MTHLDIPIIDLAPYFEGSHDGKRRVAAEINRACEDIGFFVITGHGVDPEICRSANAAAREFFDLPVAEKLKIGQTADPANRGYEALNVDGSYGRYHPGMYDQLASDHPIDLTRYQVVNCYMGRVGLINSGGASGQDDFAEAVRTAVINKRAGGMGLISGRKAFQRPMSEGVELLAEIQEVYLCDQVTIA